MNQSELEPTVNLQAAAARPPLPQSKHGVVEQAYEEFCLRRAGGEDLDPDEYCKGFPSLRSSLNRLIHAHLFLEDQGFLVDEAETNWPEVGDTFLGFRLIDELGHGSFARVFLAEEVKLGNRRVAVKIEPRGGAEADILGRLQHANVVEVFSVQEDEATGLTAVCMPYQGRTTLGDVLDNVKARAKLPTASVLPETLRETAGPEAKTTPVLFKQSHVDSVRILGVQLADALAYIHGLNICHRDLKPSNVLLSPAGVPMLLDFNLSTEAGAPPGLGGTLPYMAPEQLCGMARLENAKPGATDGRSDIFALGVILYELLTGQHPFGPLSLKLPSRDFCAFLLDRQRQGAVNACTVNPDVDRALGQLLQRCLAFDPKDRPASAADLAREVRKGMAPLTRARRWISRHARAVLAASLLVLATGASAAYYVAAVLPPFSERQSAAGEKLLKEDRFDESLEHYTASIKADLSNPATYFARGRVYLKMYLKLGESDKIDLAMNDFDHAEKLSPHGRNLAYMAYCQNLKANPKLAIGFYHRSMDSGFQSAEVQNNLGYSYLCRNNVKEARIHLDQAVSMNPASQLAFHNRAEMFRRSTLKVALRMAASKVELEKEAKRRAMSVKDYLASSSAELLSQLDLGISDVQTARQLGSSYAELEHEAACLYALAGQFDSAKLDKAIIHLEAALKKGMDPRQLAVDKAFAVLEKDARFLELLGKPSPATPLPHFSHYLDPIQDSR